jgi:hypothetical protein
MPFVEDQLAEWKAAYGLLDVPLSASSSDIRQSQRRLLKRWHPDLFTAGTNEQAEATRMTQVINEAYAKIEKAPLRYYDQARGVREGRLPRTKFEDKPDPFKNMERVEFCIKFGLGAAIGAFLALGSLPRLYMHVDPGLLGAAAIVIVSMVFFGFGAVIGGDKFWDVVFRPRWRWPW